MEQQYGEFTNVDNLHFAKVLQDDSAAYVADTPQYLAPTAEIAAETETNNTPTYYDGRPGNNYVSEGITTLTITVSNVPAKKAAELLGKDYDPASGRVLDSGTPNPPDVAVGYRAGIGQNDWRYAWYLKGTFSGGAEEAATRTADVDIRTYELTYTAVVTNKEWTFDGKTRGRKRIFGDTPDPAFNPAGWFTQVQTPDTNTPPSALQLVGSVPVNGATGVSVGATITLTFNNAIAAESIALLDTFDGSMTTVGKAWNTGKTVLTITPTAQLDEDKTYVLAVVGVVDVYGQALPATTITFETES